MALGFLSGKRVDPDAAGYLDLARRFDYSDFWAASFREPLWMAFVKTVTAPFGYDPVALRVSTTILSVVALYLAWLVFRSLLPRTQALVALGFLSLNVNLIFMAPRGLREEAVIALLMVIAIGASRWRDSDRLGPSLVAAGASLLTVVRWELGVLCVLVLVILGLSVRRARAAAAAAVAISVVLAGPWLLTNAREEGDPLHHSNIHATYVRNADLEDLGREVSNPYAGPPTTWGEYYFEFLGPAESARRTILGVPTLLYGVLHNSVLPFREQRLEELAPSFFDSPLVFDGYEGVAIGVTIILGLTFFLGLFRPAARYVVRGAAWIAFVGLLLYAPVSRHLDVTYRHVIFLLPFVAVVIGSGAISLVQIGFHYRTRRQSEGVELGRT